MPVSDGVLSISNSKERVILWWYKDSTNFSVDLFPCLISFPHNLSLLSLLLHAQPSNPNPISYYVYCACFIIIIIKSSSSIDKYFVHVYIFCYSFARPRYINSSKDTLVSFEFCLVNYPKYYYYQSIVACSLHHDDPFSVTVSNELTYDSFTCPV